MRTSIVSLLSIILLVLGCQTKQTSFMAPTEAEIEPVTTPTTYRYAPSTAKYDFKIKAINKAAGATETTSGVIHLDVSAESDGLLWKMNIPEMTAGGTHIAPDVPIVTTTFHTDIFGTEAGTITAESPWLESLPLAEKKKKKIMESLEDSMKDLSSPFTNTPIISGQPLRSEPIPSISGFKTPEGETLDLILRGEFTRNGIRYVMGEADKTIRLTTPKGGTFIMDVSGYNIMRKDTMETQLSELDISFKATPHETLVEMSVSIGKR